MAAADGLADAAALAVGIGCEGQRQRYGLPFGVLDAPDDGHHVGIGVAVAGDSGGRGVGTQELRLAQADARGGMREADGLRGRRAVEIAAAGRERAERAHPPVGAAVLGKAAQADDDVALVGLRRGEGRGERLRCRLGVAYPVPAGMQGHGHRLRGQLPVEGIGVSLAHVDLVERAGREALEEALHLTVAAAVVGLERLPEDAVSIALEGRHGDGIGERMGYPVPAFGQVEGERGVGQIHDALVLAEERVEAVVRVGALDGRDGHPVERVGAVGVAAHRLVAGMHPIGEAVGEVLQRGMGLEVGRVVGHELW